MNQNNWGYYNIIAKVHLKSLYFSQQNTKASGVYLQERWHKYTLHAKKANFK